MSCKAYKNTSWLLCDPDSHPPLFVNNTKKQREIKVSAVRTKQVPFFRGEEVEKRLLGPLKGQGAPLQLLPFRPQPMPTSTCAQHLYQLVPAYQQLGNATREEQQSAAHRRCNAKPPPTLFTSPPHVTLLKNTHEQTKKEQGMGNTLLECLPATDNGIPMHKNNFQDNTKLHA